MTRYYLINLIAWFCLLIHSIRHGMMAEALLYTALGYMNLAAMTKVMDQRMSRGP
jgi:hypothetical protein